MTTLLFNVLALIGLFVTLRFFVRSFHFAVAVYHGFRATRLSDPKDRIDYLLRVLYKQADRAAFKKRMFGWIPLIGKRLARNYDDILDRLAEKIFAGELVKEELELVEAVDEFEVKEPQFTPDFAR